MRQSTAAPRRRLWKAASSFGTVAVASLAFAASASAAAQIVTVTPDNPGVTDHLKDAINQANLLTTANGPIVMEFAPGTYRPLASLPAITKPLTMTIGVGVGHAYQASNTNPPVSINGTSEYANSPGKDLMTIGGPGAGVNVEMDGIQFDSAGSPNASGITTYGTLAMNGVEMNGPVGLNAINVQTGGALKMVSSSITSFNETGDAIALNNGNANNSFTNVSLVDGVGGAAIGVAGTGTGFSMYNSLIVFNTNAAECVGGTASNAGTTDGNVVDDASCGAVAHPSDTSTTASLPISYNGGPTVSVLVPATNTANNAGNPSFCPTTDQRFFVNQVTTPPTSTRHCDSGGGSNLATRSTKPPVCTVTRTAYPPTVSAAQQDVTVSDPAGLGPQQGDPSGTDSQPAGGVNPDSVITNLSIANGSVAFSASPFATVTFPTSLVLTATKGTQSASTTTTGTQSLPSSTLNVASTSGFAGGGQLTVGTQTVSYTGKTATQFTGVTGGAGSVPPGTTVTGNASTSWHFTTTDWAGNRADCS